MMNFHDFLEDDGFGESINPFASKNGNKWREGTISIDFLNTHFAQYSTAQEMIDATESEGLKLYFAWLRDEGKLT